MRRIWSHLCLVLSFSGCALLDRDVSSWDLCGLDEAKWTKLPGREEGLDRELKAWIEERIEWGKTEHWFRNQADELYVCLTPSRARRGSVSVDCGSELKRLKQMGGNLVVVEQLVNVCGND